MRGLDQPGNTLWIVCIGGWVAAAVGARSFGLWPAIGMAAVVLGSGVFIATPRISRLSLAPTPPLVLMGLLAAAILAGATYLLYPPVVHLWPPMAQDVAGLYAAFRAPSPLVAALALPLVVVGEELVWRGAVQSACARSFGEVPGVLLAALAYALAIAPFGSPALVVVSLACGLGWGALRAVSGSLVPTLIAHLLWNLAVLVWAPLDSIR